MIAREGLTLLGWRDVPTDNSTLGESVKPTEPMHRQVFIGRGKKKLSDERVRAQALHPAQDRSPPPSTTSASGAIGELLPGVDLLPHADLQGHVPGRPARQPIIPTCTIRISSRALALVHQRFSTNTFPTWSLAHPYRFIAHNGEINTLRGNVNWMAARQASVSSPLFGKDINKLWPISYEGQSDTACFDNALEFLVQGGYSLAHAMMMMIPEAWAGNPLMDEERRAFYEYNAALMEPWDGPAAIAFTDGRQIGATLDRNGLRPARYLVTSDDRIVMASEMGVLPIPEEEHRQEVAAAAGQDAAGRPRRGPPHPRRGIEGDAGAEPPLQGMARPNADRAGGPARHRQCRRRSPTCRCSIASRAFGYTQEDLKFLMTPMATTGEEAIGSMGNDTPISALSDRPKSLFTYFKQNFAQVTNPPIDPIREELVMSLVSIIGPRPNLLDHRRHVDAPSGSRCASRSSPTRTWRRSARSRR